MSDDDDPLRDRATDESDQDDSGRERVSTKAARALSAVASKGREALSTDAEGGGGRAKDTASRVGETLTSSGAKKLYAVVGLTVAAVAAFALVARSRGVLNAVLYSMLFMFAATLFPVLINLLGAGTPNSIGKLHLLFGAVAFDHRGH